MQSMKKYFPIFTSVIVKVITQSFHHCYFCNIYSNSDQAFLITGPSLGSGKTTRLTEQVSIRMFKLSEIRKMQDHRVFPDFGSRYALIVFRI